MIQNFVVIGANSSVSTVVSNFIFRDTSYTFEVGMTWGDFINSEYNYNSNFVAMNLLVAFKTQYSGKFICYPHYGNSNYGENVGLSDLITNITYYEGVAVGGGSEN